MQLYICNITRYKYYFAQCKVILHPHSFIATNMPIPFCYFVDNVSVCPLERCQR